MHSWHKLSSFPTVWTFEIFCPEFFMKHQTFGFPSFRVIRVKPIICCFFSKSVQATMTKRTVRLEFWVVSSFWSPKFCLPTAILMFIHQFLGCVWSSCGQCKTHCLVRRMCVLFSLRKLTTKLLISFHRVTKLALLPKLSRHPHFSTPSSTEVPGIHLATLCTNPWGHLSE